MVKRSVWRSLAPLVLLACQEAVTAPGSCPDFCPPQAVTVVDTLLPEAIATGADSSYNGYVLPLEASELQLVEPGSVPRTRGVVAFVQFPETVTLNPGDTAIRPVLQVDSFRIEVRVQRRTPGLAGELRVFRLPAGTSSSASSTDLDPWFMDSTQLGTIAIADTQGIGPVSLVVAADAFPTFTADSLRAAIGFEFHAASAGFLSLGSFEGGVSAILQRFVQVDSTPGVLVKRSDARQAQFDTFVFGPLAPGPAGALTIGGSASSRVLFRSAIPDSLYKAQIVRATLILVPAAPAQGSPGDSVVLTAHALDADFGAKSLIVFSSVDTIARNTARVGVGSADTIRIEITDIVRSWSVDSLRPRAIMVRATPEGASLMQIFLGSTLALTGRPAIHLTFVPPLGLGER